MAIKLPTVFPLWKNIHLCGVALVAVHNNNCNQSKESLTTHINTWNKNASSFNDVTQWYFLGKHFSIYSIFDLKNEVSNLLSNHSILLEIMKNEYLYLFNEIMLRNKVIIKNVVFCFLISLLVLHFHENPSKEAKITMQVLVSIKDTLICYNH